MKTMDIIRVVGCASLFFLALILQAKNVLPYGNGIIAQLQVVLSVYLTVKLPQAGFKTAVWINFIASLLAAVAVVADGELAVLPGIIIPLCTILIVHVIASVHHRLSRELAENSQHKQALQALNKQLLDKEQRLLAQNRLLKEYNEKMREHEQELHFRACHDPLTQLQNRGGFQERLTQALAEANTQSHAVALLMIDLDLFKVVNDEAGHAAGDAVLHDVGRRLAACMREQEMAYRLGGDEFMVLLEKVASRQEIRLVAERILTAMSKPFAVDARTYVIGASVGISMFPLDGDDAFMLMKEADDAMHVVKRNGGNGYCFSQQE